MPAFLRIVASLDMLAIGDRITEHDDGLTIDEYDWDVCEWSTILELQHLSDGRVALTLEDAYDKQVIVRKGWNYQTVIRERAL